MDAVTIPLGRPLSFRELRALNPGRTVEDLAAAFSALPPQLQDQAWAIEELHVALDDHGQEQGP